MRILDHLLTLILALATVFGVGAAWMTKEHKVDLDVQVELPEEVVRGGRLPVRLWALSLVAGHSGEVAVDEPVVVIECGRFQQRHRLTRAPFGYEANLSLPDTSACEVTVSANDSEILRRRYALQSPSASMAAPPSAGSVSLQGGSCDGLFPCDVELHTAVDAQIVPVSAGLVLGPVQATEDRASGTSRYRFRADANLGELDFATRVQGVTHDYHVPLAEVEVSARILECPARQPLPLEIRSHIEQSFVVLDVFDAASRWRSTRTVATTESAVSFEGLGGGTYTLVARATPLARSAVGRHSFVLGEDSQHCYSARSLDFAYPNVVHSRDVEEERFRARDDELRRNGSLLLVGAGLIAAGWLLARSRVGVSLAPFGQRRGVWLATAAFVVYLALAAFVRFV